MIRPFFCSRAWFAWSWGGTAILVGLIQVSVYIEVLLNTWNRKFFDSVQHFLQSHGDTDASDKAAFYNLYWEVVQYRLIQSCIMTFLIFFTQHYGFRWRQSLTDYYMQHWEHIRDIEGASQRIQEDCRSFGGCLEGIGIPLLQTVLVLQQFIPILLRLSRECPEVPILGRIDHSLVWVAMYWSGLGTLVHVIVGWKLPGLAFNIQRAEAAYRKELVYGEDNTDRVTRKVSAPLFDLVQQAYYSNFWHYLYFNFVRQNFMGFSFFMPYLVVLPAIMNGSISLGQIQQIHNTFIRVDGSLQMLVRNYHMIIDLLSIWKRLRAFNLTIAKAEAKQSKLMETAVRENGVHNAILEEGLLSPAANCNDPLVAA